MTDTDKPELSTDGRARLLMRLLDNFEEFSRDELQSCGTSATVTENGVTFYAKTELTDGVITDGMNEVAVSVVLFGLAKQAVECAVTEERRWFNVENNREWWC